MNGRHTVLAISLTAATLAATYGGTSVTAQSDKGGNSVPPVALEMAVANGSGLIDTFAARVEELSDGQMRIDVDWDGGSEPIVAGRVHSGDADLGWLAARGLNGADVHDLDALIVPFLVSDRRLLNEIITGPIGADMLAGLADDGLEGLALLPGGQRFFVGIGRPLTAPADFAGARIGLVQTPVLERIVDSLGGEPVELDMSSFADYEAQGIDGILTVVDNLALVPDTYMTNNLVPYTVPGLILANAKVMATLSPEQQAILRAAAVELRDQLLAEMPEVEGSAVRCAVGASVIEATDADVAAIEAATQPVRDWLSSDPATAEFIERIETLKGELPAPSWPTTCGAPPPTDAALASIPDGTYTTQVTRADALRTGFEDDCTLDDRVKTVTLVIEGDRFTELQACGYGESTIGSTGTFEYRGDQLIKREPGYAGQATFSWSVEDDTLRLEVVETDEAYDPLSVLRFLFEHEFTKIAPVGAPTHIPDGTYTTQVTKADALRTGFEDDCTLDDRVKTVTLVIEGDRFTELQACGDGPMDIGSEGTFEYQGDRVTSRESGIPGSATYAWSLDGDRLTMKVVEADEGYAPMAVLQFLFEHEFVRSAS